MSDGMGTNKTIELAAPKRGFSLGGPIPIGVRYTNKAPVEIRFRDPQKTWEVQLRIGDSDVPFGKIRRITDRGMVSWAKEPAEEIVVAPGSQHAFQYDAGKRWPERFAPGVNTLQVKDLTDDAETVLSNPINVQVDLTAESFPAFVGLLESEESTPEAKEFAERWVRRLHPEFTTPAEARSWWAQNGATPAMAATIAKINQDAAKQ